MQTSTGSQLALALVLSGLMVSAPRETLAAGLTARLEQGEVVTSSVEGTGGVSPGRAMALLNAPPGVVRDVLAGLEHYPSFVPRVVGSRQVKPNHFVIQLKLPWPVGDTWVYVQVRSGARDGAEIVTSRMLNGQLKAYEGTAWVQPFGKGRSLLTYQLLAVPDSSFAPESMVSRGLRDAAGGMVEAVRNRVRQVLAANPGVQVAAEPPRVH